MKKIILPFLLFGLFACTNTKININERDLNSEEAAFSVTLIPEINTAIAGTDIGYTLQVLNLTGEEVDPTSWTLSSSLEPDWLWTSESFLVTVAGEHDVTVSVQVDGEEYQATQIFPVTAGSIVDVDLVVDSYSAQAGERIPYSATAYDQYNNAVENAEIEFLTDSPDLLITADKVFSNRTGLYLLSASIGGMSDLEHIQVFAGEAVSLSLLVPDQNVERYESLNCDVIIEDEFGNETEDSWILWAEGDGLTTISYDIVTFWDEGTYNIYAEVEGTALSDSYGPIYVDSSGPNLEIYTPPRGEWTEAASTEVTGNVVEEYSLLSNTSVNGSSVTPTSSGDFIASVYHDLGITLVETIAEDSDGNDTTDTRAILSGDFLPEGTPIEDGFVVYLGQSGVQTIENYADDMIGNLNIASMLPSNPIAQESVAWCTANINLHNISYGNTSVDINPNANGTITTTLTVNNFDVDVDVPLTGGSWSPCPDFSGSVSASSLTATLILEPYVSGNQLYISLNSSSSSLNGLNVNLSGWASILDFVVNIFESDIASLLEAEIQSAIEAEIPPLLEDILQSIAIDETIDVLGGSYTLSAVPSSVGVDNYGIELGLQTNISSTSWTMPSYGLGSLYESYATPSFTTGSSVNIAMSTDVVNQLLYQIWGGGLMAQELSLNDLGIGGDELSLIFPNASDLRVTIDPMLPPVAIPDGSGSLELQMGEFYIALHDGAYSAGDIRMELYAHIFAPLSLSASASTIEANIGTPISYFDVVYPEVGSNSAEALLEALVPIILPSLTDAITSIEIPAFSGFSISGTSSTVTSGHIKISGTIGY